MLTQSNMTTHFESYVYRLATQDWQSPLYHCHLHIIHYGYPQQITITKQDSGYKQNLKAMMCNCTI